MLEQSTVRKHLGNSNHNGEVSCYAYTGEEREYYRNILFDINGKTRELDCSRLLNRCVHSRSGMQTGNFNTKYYW